MLKVVVAVAEEIVNQELGHLVDLVVVLDKSAQLCRELLPIQIQIPQDRDTQVEQVDPIQVLDGLVLVVAEVLVVLVLLEILVQEALMQIPLVAVVESVSNYHQHIEIQILE